MALQLENKDYQRFLSKVPYIDGVWDDHDYGGKSGDTPQSLTCVETRLAYCSFLCYLFLSACENIDVLFECLRKYLHFVCLSSLFVSRAWLSVS